MQEPMCDGGHEDEGRGRERDHDVLSRQGEEPAGRTDEEADVVTESPRRARLPEGGCPKPDHPRAPGSAATIVRRTRAWLRTAEIAAGPTHDRQLVAQGRPVVRERGGKVRGRREV